MAMVMRTEKKDGWGIVVERGGCGGDERENGERKAKQSMLAGDGLLGDSGEIGRAHV